MRIVNKLYNIENTNVNKSIVLISDIHYYEKSEIKHLNKVLDNIKRIHPDYICIPGDILDESNVKDEEEFLNWLTKLSTICKVIISIGNHEYYINKSKRIFKLNTKFYNKLKNINNIYLLDNNNIIIDNINFIGVTLPIDYYIGEEKNIELFEKIFKNIVVSKKYNILLCHSPKIYTSKLLKNVNLVLCGHTHGGAVPCILRPIFKNNGLISPTKKLFPHDVYGKLKRHNTNIIITSGIRVISHINKLRMFKNFFASEIVTIKLT